MPLPDNFPVLVFAILVILLAGAVVFYAVVRDPLRFSRLERLAYCYPLGMATLAMPMFLASWAGYHISVMPVLLAIAAGAGIAYAIRRVPPAILWKRNPDAPRSQPFNEFEWCLLVLIAGCLLVRTMTSLVIPLNDGDGHAVWCFKAKILYYDTIRTTDYFGRHELNYSNVRYPLLVPFMYAWVSTVAGQWEPLGILILNPTNLVVFAILLYCTLRRFTVRPIALAVLVMLSSLPALMHYAECAQGDVPLMLIGGASLFCLFDWVQNRRTDSLILAAFLMGGAVFTKEEGRILFMAHVTVGGLSVLWMTSRSCWLAHTKQLGIYIGIVGIMTLPWFLFRQTIVDQSWAWGKMGISTIQWEHIPTLLNATIQTAVRFQNNVNLPKWNLLWPLVVLTLLVNWRQTIRPPWACLLAIWFLHACGVSLVILATPVEPTYDYYEVGFERYTLIMSPPLWLLLGVGLTRCWEIWHSRLSASE
ncbi:MAG: hypothetical protein PCFJNLEI_02914 [Verrucomicrobiae bacterium]|nr:hypothetical protein [Verrucomicrobiae bacterium]